MISWPEFANLKSQNVMSSEWGGDRQFGQVFEAIRALISEKQTPKRRIGFAKDTADE
jgi:hypothetical protein